MWSHEIAADGDESSDGLSVWIGRGIRLLFIFFRIGMRLGVVDVGIDDDDVVSVIIAIAGECSFLSVGDVGLFHRKHNQFYLQLVQVMSNNLHASKFSAEEVSACVIE